MTACLAKYPIKLSIKYHVHIDIIVDVKTHTDIIVRYKDKLMIRSSTYTNIHIVMTRNITGKLLQYL